MALLRQCSCYTAQLQHHCTGLKVCFKGNAAANHVRCSAASAAASAADSAVSETSHHIDRRQPRSGIAAGRADHRSKHYTSKQSLYTSQPRLLTAHIRKCSSWQQVQELLQESGVAVNHVHLAAAVVHCAHMYQQQVALEGQGRSSAGRFDGAFNSWLFSTVDQLLEQHAEFVEPRHLSNMLWAVAKCCQHVHPSTIQQLLHLQLIHFAQQQQQQEQQQQQQQQQEEGEKQRQEEQQQGQLAICVSALPAAPNTATPVRSHRAQDLANSLWALASLQHSPSEAWLKSFWAVSIELLDTFPVQELSNTVWAAAKLQLHVPQPWLQRFMSCSQRQMQTQQDVVFPDGGSMGSGSGSEGLWQCSSSSSTSVMNPHWQQHDVSRRASAAASPVAAAIYAQAMALTGHGLASLGCRPEDPWLHQYYVTTGQLLPAYSAQHLSMTLWAVATWGAVPMPADWVARFLACAQQQLRHLTVQGIVNIAASCYHLLVLLQGSTPPQQQCLQQMQQLRQLLAAMLEAAEGQAEHLPVSAAAALAWASSGSSHPAPGRQHDPWLTESAMLPAGGHNSRQQQQQPSPQQMQQQQQQASPQQMQQQGAVSNTLPNGLTWLASFLSIHTSDYAAVLPPSLAAGTSNLQQDPDEQDSSRSAGGGSNSSSSCHGNSHEHLLLLLWLCAKGNKLPSGTRWCAATCTALSDQRLNLTGSDLARLTWAVAQLLRLLCREPSESSAQQQLQQQTVLEGTTPQPAAVSEANSSRSGAQEGQGQGQSQGQGQGQSQGQGQDQGQDKRQDQGQGQALALRALAARLLHQLPGRLQEISQLQLIEAVSGAAQICTALQQQRQQQQQEQEEQSTELTVTQEQQQQNRQWQWQQHGWDVGVCAAAVISAAAASAQPHSLQGHHLTTLLSSLHRMLLVARGSLYDGRGSHDQLQQHLLQLLSSVAEVLPLLPPATAVSAALHSIALGAAVVPPAAKSITATLTATRSTALAPAPVTTETYTAAAEASSVCFPSAVDHQLLLGWQQLQEQLQLAVHSRLQLLQAAEVLAAARQAAWLHVQLSGSTLAALLYGLQRQVSSASYGPKQLLQLLQLLPCWRHIPVAALPARKALLGSWLGATHRLMVSQLLWQQRQQQQVAGHQQSHGCDFSGGTAPVVAAGLSGAVTQGHAAPVDASPAAVTAVGSELMKAVLAGLMVGLAKLHLRPPDQWMSCYQQLLLRELPALPAQELSKVLWSFAKLGYRPPDRGMHQLLQASRVLLPVMTHSEIVRVVYALGKLRAVPDDPWLQCFYARVEAAPGKFEVSGFGMLVWALAKLGVQPQQAWLQRLLDSTFAGYGEQQQYQRLEMKPQHLANLICAFAKLQFAPGQEWLAWFRAELGQQAGLGGLQQLDHFHIEWAWRELHDQYRLAVVAAAEDV